MISAQLLHNVRDVLLLEQELSPPPPAGTTAADTLSSLQYRAHLLRFLTSHFGEEDLRTLIFNLGVDYDGLPACGSSGKAQELVLYMERRGRLPEVAQIGQVALPDMPWSEIV